MTQIWQIWGGNAVHESISRSIFFFPLYFLVLENKIFLPSFSFFLVYEYKVLFFSFHSSYLDYKHKVLVIQIRRVERKEENLVLVN